LLKVVKPSVMMMMMGKPRRLGIFRPPLSALSKAAQKKGGTGSVAVAEARRSGN